MFTINIGWLVGVVLPCQNFVYFSDLFVMCGNSMIVAGSF
jgi:hypothetical protein